MDDIWGPVAPPQAGHELADAPSLVAGGDFRGALKVLRPLIAADSANGRAQVLYCRTLYALKEFAQAAQAARSAIAAVPNNSRLHAILAQSLIAQGKTAEAQACLDEAARNHSGNDTIAALQAETQLKAGEYKRALEASDRAVTLDPSSPAHAALNVVLRWVNGVEIPQALIEIADRESVLEITRKLVLLLRRQKLADLQRRLVARALALLPGAHVLRIMHAESMLAEHKPAEALAALGELADPDAAIESMGPALAIRMLVVRGEAHRALKDADAARADYERILTLDPENEDALEKLYLLHRRLGDDQQMRAYAKRIARTGGTKMPATLAEGLAALATSDTRLDLGSEKIDWAWSLADTKTWERDRWLEEVKWGRRADLLLRAWWLNLFERGDEIAALIDPQSPGLDDLLKPGERALAVASHLGPMAGFVYSMQTCGRPFRGFGFSGPDPVVGDAPPMRIASNQANTAASLRELVGEIQKGTLIGFAPDSPVGREKLEFDFLGRRVAISTLVPRLAQRHGAASVFCQALWHGDRIRLSMQRLPDPRNSETAEAFAQRWSLAYLAALEPVMRGDPRNLNLGSGIWKHIPRPASP